MRGLRASLGKAVLAANLHGLALRSKLFSLAASGGFHSFGRRTVLERPVRIIGASRMAIGSDVYVGAGSCLQTLGNSGDCPALIIGDGTSIAGTAVLSAATCVHLGERVLLARNVYIADHMHAFDDLEAAVIDQNITRIAPVRIGDGAWLGQNVVVCPGVSIGRGAVIGANSVVLDDVPAHVVAVGAPARIVRRLGEPDPLASRLEVAQ
jgi:acetyltransferase-like isoleucine patch superfamily enzyme